MTTMTITFGFSESMLINEGAEFDNMPDAERYACLAATQAPSGGCYDKTDVTIAVGDDSFKMRLDITAAMKEGTPIHDHVDECARYYRKRADAGDSYVSDDDAGCVERILAAAQEAR